MGPLFIPPSSKLADDCTSSSQENSKSNSNSQDVISLGLLSSKTKSCAAAAGAMAKGNNGNLRKYVVIAQDCVAVKMTREPNCGRRFNGVSSEAADGGQDNGMDLFKLFLQSNSKCHWNDQLVDSLNSLQYKGHITPNIILIYSSTRHLNTLRTAWSRRIIREPPGYKLEMLGDVEEIFTQPIGQSQFAPLSDSLCWAIMHLCSNGMEAFVDSIIGTLGACFPGMEIPSKELVFQTLEKLIKEQKIYQTANGYFIVTPEVSSYIASSSGVSCCSPVACHHRDYEFRHLDIIDALSHHSWGSVPSLDEPRSRNNTLKRHNSLRVVSKRDEVIPRPHMGARSLSFRLSKRNSILDEPTNSTPTPELVVVDTIDQGTQVDQPTESLAAAKKRRSLFARLFSFKKPSPRPKEPSPKPEQKPSPSFQSQSTCSTQTQSSSSSPSSTSSSSYNHRRHSLIHIPVVDNTTSHYELLHHHQHHTRSKSHGRSSSLSHHHHTRSRTRSRASSPCSNTSNIYASLRCTPTAEYNTRSRRLSRASVHDLYRTASSKVDKDAGQLISSRHRSIESSDDVSH